MDIQTDKPKRILLIDDQPVCRLGLERILRDFDEFTFDGYASSLEKALAPSRSPDIIAIDIETAKSRGVSAIKDLKRTFPKAVILVITSHDEILFAERCLKAGAQGYLMKTAPKTALVQAFKDVSHGHLHLSDRMRARMLGRLNGETDDTNTVDFDRLSDRELLIVQHIGQSRNNREIANQLHISVKTIESHRSRIKSKLSLHTPNELIRFAMRLQDSMML